MSSNVMDGAALKPDVERVPVAVILALGLTQNIGYGTLYYSFSILAPSIAKDFSWSNEWIFGALSVALLIGGLTAPWTGRGIDRFGAGRMLTIGSILAALALTACAFSPGKTVFVVALIAVQISSNLVQYGAAFALLVQIRPRTAQRSITYLTLLAGFASTIFWPITSALNAHMSWQNVYLIYAALNLFLCLPIHAWLSGGLAQTRKSDTSKTERAVAGSLAPAARMTGFLLMVTGFALQSFVNAAVLAHMVPMLSAIGLGSAGVTVGTLFGPSQVLSRFTNMIFGRDLSQLTLALISAVLMPGAVALLTLTAPSLSGALAFAVLFGLGSGLNSIVQGTLTLALFGSDGYGQRQGQVLAVRLVVSSAAPFAMAFMMENIGVPAALMFTGALGSISIAAFLGIGRLEPKSDPL
ncbi:MFS family permease [Rhizobium sp. BK313]|uniref:arsenite efflux MFS transporter ArsK n=1 Tax=Rhizobium sp. BK313 TaxID=2587081 RepID=UPI00182B55B0|nr:arsenite efflux MFS transporter ArsK [Rhizobium sp. BK313]MBB3452030.1 MFS family permease [Rhizobium sp. BK313]